MFPHPNVTLSVSSASLEPPAEQREPTAEVWLCDRYRVDAQLGHSGIITPYRAWDRKLELDVVVKVPLRSLASDEKFSARFLYELRSLLPLTHPHLTKIINLEKHDGLPLTIAQFFPGGSIEDRRPISRGQGFLPVHPYHLFPWLKSLGKALDVVHAHGCVYGDLKTTKILFSPNEQVYLSEFFTTTAAIRAAVHSDWEARTGERLTRPLSPAPEQASSQPLTGKADQYALALVVLDLLTGRRFKTPTEAFGAGMLTGEVRRVLARALSERPAERFDTCRDFAVSLQEAADIKSPGKVRLTPIKQGQGSCPSCATVLYLSETSRGQNTFCPRCKAALHITENLGWVSELPIFRYHDATGG